MTGCLKRLAIALGLIAAVIVITFLLIRQFGRAALRDEIDAWRSAGGSADMVDFAPAAVPDDLNAALIYQRAFDALPVWSDALDNFAKNRAPGAEPPHEFTDAADAIQLAHSAAALDKCAWPCDYSAGFNMLLPHLGKARSLARFLVLDASLRADADDLETASRDLEAALALSRAVSTDPILICTLVTIAIDSMVIDAFGKVFADRDIPASCRVVDMLAARDYRALARRSLLAEGTGTLMQYERGDLADFLNSEGTVTAIGRIIPQDMVEYLKFMRAHANSYTQPIEADLSLPDQENLPRWALTARLLTPAMDGFRRQVAFAESRSCMTRFAFALRAYKTAHGSYPDDAAIAAGAIQVPIDPVTRKPFEYRRDDADGFFLISPGLPDRPQNNLEWHWSR